MIKLFGHIKGLKSNLISHLEKNFDKDNRFFLDLPLNKYFFTSNKNDYSEILIKRYSDFEKGKSSRILKLLFGGGLVVAPISQWKKNRKIIGPAFTKSNALILSYYIDTILEKWGNEVLTDGKHNIFEAFNKLSVVIAMKSTLGVANEQFENPFYYNIQDAQKIVISKVKSLININWTLTAENRLFKKIIKEIRNELDSYIRLYLESQSSYEESDYKYPIDALARGFRNGQLQYEDLLDEVITLITAGYETTSTTLTWTLILLLKNPQYFNYAMLNEDNLTNCIFESIRLYPATWCLGRSTTKWEKFGNYTLPPKTEILLLNYHTHRSSKYWDNPLQFNPKRFENGMCDKREKEFNFVPFGAGPRGCIGKNLAMLMLNKILGFVIKKYHFRIIDEKEIDFKLQFTLGPSSNIYMDVKKI